MKTIGIIGLGNFGQFAAAMLATDKNLRVLAYDPKPVEVPAGATLVSFEDAATADAIVLCIPLSAYKGVLGELKPLIREQTLIVDICSVKVEAAKGLREHLPEHNNFLITHPMFGPQSAANGLEGHALVVTETVGERAQAAVDYCQDHLKLKIVHMTNEEHDREMANVHALTFFVARGLTDFGVRPGAFDPPSFKWLLDLSALDKHHSEDLFRTMEVGNPFAKSAREKFVKTLRTINYQLEKDKI